MGGAEGGDDGHLAVGEAEGAEQKERASSKAEEKEKSGDKGGKEKGGAKGGAKGQGGGAAAATVRVWEVKQEVCLTFYEVCSEEICFFYDPVCFLFVFFKL